MKTTPIRLAILAGAMLATNAAQATTLHLGSLAINFNLGSGGGSNTPSSSMGNTRTFSAGGINLTSTAWSLSSLSAGFAASQLGLATNYGMWVCNPTEGINCPSSSHQIDNKYGFDFVLFQFSEAVDPASITIKTYSNSDLDVSYFLGNTASNLSLAGVNLSQLAALGFGAGMNSDVTTSATSRIVSINNSLPVNSLLIGARTGGDASADFFKITNLAVDQPGPSGVPEPGTFALTGVALVGLGIARRGKKN